MSPTRIITMKQKAIAVQNVSWCEQQSASFGSSPRLSCARGEEAEAEAEGEAPIGAPEVLVSELRAPLRRPSSSGRADIAVGTRQTDRQTDTLSFLPPFVFL
jgi:hypothetical protein